MKIPRWTEEPGTGGFIRNEEDFIVKEVIHRKYFSKYKTSGGIKKEDGKYNLFLLRKKNLTTHSALEIISKKFGKPIGFAGLKDKHAVTEQYITMPDGFNFRESGIELEKVGTTDRTLSKGDLVGNEFSITLNDCDKIENLPEIAGEINKRGFPNFFGPQRFGISGNNHCIGKLIVKRKFYKALNLINKSYKKNYKEIYHAPKETLKFFVNAYQSLIFNELLAGYVKKKKYFSGHLPIVGCNTKSKLSSAILKKEGIKPKDFKISELRISCSGGKRKAFIKTYVNYTISGDKAVLKFTLPHGSYATVLLGEITKRGFAE